ncbi:lasso peptide biosynthesis B2 protein [Embleya sp. NPDC020630]|uniref:lasso peptide biosynthesis B2 protein n=1 Tax=Embleya sp. NPDC020630 TaxID=3363979 RepID=UPI0037A3013A
MPVPLRHRAVAGAGLAAALLLKPLPLRVQLAALRVVVALPAASRRRVEALHTAVEAVRPVWWPGRLACLETQIATVVACALTGRRVHLVFGARLLPCEAHAWLRTPQGDVALGEDAVDRPWTPALIVPAMPDAGPAETAPR